MPRLPLSPQVASILSAHVADRTGLWFDESHLPAFGERVADRAAELGFESLLDYYYYLRYDAGGAAELDALVETLVVGETYLFRELAPLEVLVSEIVAPICAAGKRRSRIWCAAAATGEEPCTVAMLLAARGILGDVEIVASDISAAALARAHIGQLSRRALRQEEIPAFAAPWVEVGAGGVRVRQGLIDAIEWRRVNLVDDAAVVALGTFDAILCRNVLIYFHDETTRRVVTRLGERLRPEGVLLVGVSESLLRFGVALTCEERGGAFLYRKPA